MSSPHLSCRVWRSGSRKSSSKRAEKAAIQDIAPRKLTYQDYLVFPADGRRHEVLDGEHYVTGAPSRWHQTASLNLSYFLAGFLRLNPLGHVFAAPFEVVLSEHNVAQPDLLFVSRERTAILTDKNVQGAPDLIIEILSASTRRADEGIKRAMYERYGGAEYWLVDPQRRTVRVFRRAGAVFGSPAELSTGHVLATPLLPRPRNPRGRDLRLTVAGGGLSAAPTAAAISSRRAATGA